MCVGTVCEHESWYLSRHCICGTFPYVHVEKKKETEKGKVYEKHIL